MDVFFGVVSFCNFDSPEAAFLGINSTNPWVDFNDYTVCVNDIG